MPCSAEKPSPHPALIAGIMALGLLLGSGPVAAQTQPPAHAPSETAAADRQKALLADAERLLALANQLKIAVDKSRRDELSMQVIREADEIERLAKAAKSRIQ